MHRFYVEEIIGDKAVLAGESVHHLRDVLRLKVGDAIIAFDGAGKEYQAVIVAVGKKQVELNITPLKIKQGNHVQLTVACAIPKGSRMDDVIDHLTQLGVECIIPMLTDRVVVKLDSPAMKSRFLRWQKIAQSAAQQCRRSSVPVILPVTDVEEVITKSQDFDLKLLPHLSGKRTLIKNVFSRGSYKNIIVLIGPEGDFTPEEVSLALHNGFVPVSLGDAVLRVATAAIAIASYIRFTLDKK
jgi:16S rRNA (uracil1498-N3)-methyltransferase